MEVDQRGEEERDNLKLCCWVREERFGGQNDNNLTMELRCVGL